MRSAPSTETEPPAASHLAEEFPQQPQRSLKVPIALGFSVTGLATILYCGILTQVANIPVTAQFGLLQMLPVAYWFGLLMMGLGILVALRSSSEAAILATGVLFFAAFAGTSVLFEPNPPIWDSYMHYREAQFIGTTGDVPSEPDRYATNWPGFFLITWFVSQVGAIAPMAYLNTYPFLAGGLTFLALFLFLRSLFPLPLASAGSVIGSLLNVWAQYHVSPQSFGLVLFLLVLASAWKKSVPWRTANAILFVGLVVTHPTSILLLLSVLGVDLALTYCRRLPAVMAGTPPPAEGRFAFTPIASYAIIWLGWLFFQARGSSQIAETVVLTRMGAILRLPEQTANIATARAVENVWTWAPLIRLAVLALFVLIGLISLILLWREARRRRIAQFLASFLVGAVFFALVDVFAFRGQFYDRSLMLYALLAPSVGLCAVAAVRGIPKPVRAVVPVVLLGAAMLATSTVYYQEALYFVSDEARSLTQFLERAVPRGLVLDGLYPAPVWMGTTFGNERSTLAFYTMYPQHLDTFDGGTPVYAVFDDVSELWYRQYRGIDILQLYMKEITNYSLIYGNGKTEVFLISTPNLGA